MSPTRLSLASVLCLASALQTQADILYAMDRGILTRIDTDTLVATPIGDSGIVAMAGLEFGPSGQLFGMAPDADEFVSIDITTGQATIIGSCNIPISRATGLGWDSTTGRMYSVAKFTPSTLSILTTVSLTNGGATFVAELSDLGNAGVSGLDFDVNGQLYAIREDSAGNQLWAIDKSNGQGQFIVQPNLPTTGSFTIAPSGIAWTIGMPGILYSIDLEDGAIVNHGQITGFTDGAVQVGALASIPAPSSAVAVLAGLLISHRRTRP